MLATRFAWVFLLASTACSSKSEAPAQPQPVVATPAPARSQEPAAALTRITDPSTVCMINDQHMGVPQIPVSVEGKTYYGCCQACEAKLKNNAQARLAVDPVTRQQVDKASAVLAKTERGNVLYFENEANLVAYSGGQ